METRLHSLKIAHCVQFTPLLLWNWGSFLSNALRKAKQTATKWRLFFALHVFTSHVCYPIPTTFSPPLPLPLWRHPAYNLINWSCLFIRLFPNILFCRLPSGAFLCLLFCALCTSPPVLINVSIWSTSLKSKAFKNVYWRGEINGGCVMLCLQCNYRLLLLCITNSTLLMWLL